MTRAAMNCLNDGATAAQMLKDAAPRLDNSKPRRTPKRLAKGTQKKHYHPVSALYIMIVVWWHTHSYSISKEWSVDGVGEFDKADFVVGSKFKETRSLCICG